MGLESEEENRKVWCISLTFTINTVAPRTALKTCLIKLFQKKQQNLEKNLYCGFHNNDFDANKYKYRIGHALLP